MRLPAYSKYKDSGVEWLGDVPMHWEVERSKWLFRHKKQINYDRTNTNVLSLTLRGVVNNNPDNPEGLVPKDYATYQLFCKGDLVFKLIDLENRKTSRVGLVHEDGIMSSAYLRLIPLLDVNIDFFFRQYFDLYLRGIYNQLGAGVRSTLGASDLLNLNVLVPPLPEQTAIVRYLDYVERRIQRYAGTKRKLLGLLAEQKQAIIHRAVTRGLDPDVPLKPSGVEWLGDVPGHWKVRKLRTMFRVHGSGTTPSGDYYYGGGVPWVMTGDLNDCDITETKRTVTPAAIEKVSALRMFPPGSLLVAMYGATIGKTGILTMEACTNQACCVLAECIDSSSISLLQATVNLARPHLIEQSYGGGQPNINAEIVRSLKVPIPPLSEQIAIAEYLDKTTTRIDAVIARTQREIELINEYRTRLIADVVTGKVDVRETAAKLSDESDAGDVMPDSDADDALDSDMTSDEIIELDMVAEPEREY